MLDRRWSVSKSTIYEMIRNGPLPSFVWRASFCGSPLKRSRDMKTGLQPRGSQANELNVRRGCRWLSSSGAGPSRSDEAWEIFGSSSFSGFENRLFQKRRALPLSPGSALVERTICGAMYRSSSWQRMRELAGYGYGGYPAALSCFRRIRIGRLRRLRTRSGCFSDLYCALALIKCVPVASLRCRRGAQGDY